jgi:hypothetical protein
MDGEAGSTRPTPGKTRSARQPKIAKKIAAKQKSPAPNAVVPANTPTSSPQSLTLEVSGAILPWVPTSTRDRSVMLMDLEPDLLSPNTIRFFINIAFQHIIVPVQIGGKTVNWRIGATGADVHLRTSKGRVSDYTLGEQLGVDYKNSVTKSRSSKATIKPSVKKKDGRGEIEASGGEVTFESGEARTRETAFHSSERELQAIFQNDSVRWVLSLAKGEKAVRDYILGNMFLSATCSWPSAPIRGEISARPLDVRFFTTNGPTAEVGSLALLWRTKKKQRRIEGESGWTARFREVR